MCLDFDNLGHEVLLFFEIIHVILDLALFEIRGYLLFLVDQELLHFVQPSSVNLFFILGKLIFDQQNIIFNLLFMFLLNIDELGVFLV